MFRWELIVVMALFNGSCTRISLNIPSTSPRYSLLIHSTSPRHPFFICLLLFRLFLLFQSFCFLFYGLKKFSWKSKRGKKNASCFRFIEHLSLCFKVKVETPLIFVTHFLFNLLSSLTSSIYFTLLFKNSIKTFLFRIEYNYNA